MRAPLRRTALAAAIIGCIPFGAHAQLEEILVTATRRETDLQSTPISIQAFTSQELELSGITAGRDLGIMVPNLVANPQGGGAGQPTFYIRGLPGVGIYIDGIWQSSWGFLESNFAEVDRLEVLRGPQGTLFGRNTNGGAINITTRKPADEFGVRMNFDVGSFNRRNATVAVDAPLTSTIKTKFMVSSLKNDGFLKDLILPRSLGNQDDQLMRFDFLWEPTDKFNLRFTANNENKAGTEPRIVRITNTNNIRYIQYNVLAGNPSFVNIPGFTVVNWGFPANAFTAVTHQPGYPGGEVGKWETKSDTPANGITRDLKYYTMTANWKIGDHLSLQSISSAWEMNRRQSVDFDGSEFIITTDEVRARDHNFTEELHVTGSNLNDRLNWIAGFYSLTERTQARTYRWSMADIPRSPTNINAYRTDVKAYLDNWWAAAGQPTFQGAAAISADPPPFNDQLQKIEGNQKALFGEVTISATKKLDLTVGLRVTDDNGRVRVLTPTSGPRPLVPGDEPRGDIYQGIQASVSENPDLGNNITHKYGIQYHLTKDMMLYASRSEGFTETSIQRPQIPTSVNGVCPAVLVATVVPLRREVITNKELGFRSTWRDNSLRFNATYFDATWDGMRVNNLPIDPCTGSPAPFPYLSADGGGLAHGWELEFAIAPTERLRFNVNLGIIQTEYTARGFFDGTNGIGPNTPFAYAPDNSAALGVEYNIPVQGGGKWTIAGNYGWSDQYTRDNANQRTPVDASGNYIFEPAYGILNSRVTYTPSAGKWTASLWGTNLTDVQYVNGGFDTRFVWGYDFSVIGQSRELGASLSVHF